MSNIATFGGVEIPLVTDLEIERVFVGDRGDTASGRLRQDSVRTKRRWRLRTAKITRVRAEALLNHLKSIEWGEGQFWLDEFGAGNTVTAIVLAETVRESRTPFGDSSGWHADGRQLEFTVAEV